MLMVLTAFSSFPVSGLAEQSEKLETARKKLTFKTLSTEDISAVTEDIMLPVEFEGCFIVWKCENENLLNIIQGGESLIGSIIRPPFGEGDATAILTATIIDENQFTTKNFAICVPESEIGYTYSNTILKAREQFDFDFLSAQNIFALRDDPTIPKVTDDAVAVTIETDRPEILSADGKITRGYDSDETVCITAFFQFGNEKLKRSYPVIVKAYNTAEIQNKMDEDLQNVQNNVLEQYNTNNLTQNISLPQLGKNGSSLTWESSDDSVISSDGDINQRESATQAILTVKAEFEGLSAVASIPVTVARRVAAPAETKSSGGSTAMKPTLVTNDSDTPAIPQKNSYVDVDNTHWAYTEIETLTKKGIINGIGNGVFAPQNALKREEAVKLLLCTMQVDKIEGDMPFADADVGAWYGEYLITACKAGIVSGIDESIFGIGKEITRQDFVVILCKTLDYCHKTLPKQSDAIDFTDENLIAPYARDSVMLLSANNILNGMPDGSFMPLKTMTRAEASVVICRILSL